MTRIINQLKSNATFKFLFKVFTGLAPEYLQELFSLRNIQFRIVEKELSFPKLRTNYRNKS